MPGRAGLHTDLTTWAIMAVLVVCWMASLRLVPGWVREGWPSLLKSLFGFVWLGFGVDILLRFSMLSYNAVEWGSGSQRLVALPLGTVNTTLACCALFWVPLCLGFGFAVRRGTAGPMGHIRVLTPEFAYSAAVPSAALASLAFYLTEGRTGAALPVEWITPISLLASLYVVPATIIWWDHFRRPGPKWRIGAIHLLVLLPALVRGWLSPYRENLAPLLLVPLIAAVFAGLRPSLRKLVPAALACFLALTLLVSSYRQIKWGNARVEEVAYEVRQARFSDWIIGDWAQSMRRFHAFDSMLLTVFLVPSLEPYSGRDVLASPFIQGFVPRFIYQSKGAGDQGIHFGERIWAFDDPWARSSRVGSIAPSMPGDLFDAGGFADLILGGLIWGLLLGLVDGWKKHLPAFCAAAITSQLATHCAMSVERDFAHSVATLIQGLLVLALGAGAIALSRRGFGAAAAFDPRLRDSQGFAARGGVTGFGQ
jgi:hypothetical protein